MQIILLEKLHNLGNLGDTVKVKPGYARNYLIPQKKAVPATEQHLARFEARRAELEKAAAAALHNAQVRGEKLAQLTIEIKAKAGDEGKLFGSVSNRDIAKIIHDKGVEVEKNEILMPGGVIRVAGEYEITVQLHSDVRIPLKVSIIPE